MSSGSHGWYYTVKDEIKKFDGTPEESQNNFDSHDWTAGESSTKHCATCGVREYQTTANYRCGTTDFPMVKMVYEYSGNDPVRIYEYKPFDPRAPRSNESS